MKSGEKTVPKKIIFFLCIIFIILTLSAAGCISPAQQTPWTPQITKLTDYPEYNLYFAEYAHDDKLDELLSENITDIKLLSERISQLCAPGSNVKINLPTIGCSVFLASDGDDFIVGRNYDLDDTDCMIVHTTPVNGYESIAFADISMYASDPENPADAAEARVAPYLSMDGLNEAGVCISVLAVDGPAVSQNTGKAVVNPPLIIRLVLDKAGSTDEAVNLISQYDANFKSPFQFFIADRTGKSAVVNYIQNEMTVTYNQKLLTNFYICPVPDDYPAGHGEDRYETAEEMLEETRYQADAKRGFEILRAAAQTPETGGIGTTQWSVVYHLSKGYADVVFQRNWDDIHSCSLSEVM